MIPYEQRLNENVHWALLQGSMHFENRSEVHHALRRIVKRLDELDVPYAVAGDMAMFFHGFRRFTETVVLLVTREGWETIRRNLEGGSYLAPDINRRHLRDAESGVLIRFLLAGDYPGDREPKPVVLPDPAGATVTVDGLKLLRLASLAEMKLASGMTSPGRLQDLADAQELIRRLHLPAEFAGQLSPFVRDKYAELWSGLQGEPPPE